jgi:hypothetical protein
MKGRRMFLLLLLALVSCRVHAHADGFGRELLDRRMAAERLQNYSDYSGWEARFAVAGHEGTTLAMTGSLLCDDDFPEIVPPSAWALVPEAGFEWFECRLPDQAKVTRIRIAR